MNKSNHLVLSLAFALALFLGLSKLISFGQAIAAPNTLTAFDDTLETEFNQAIDLYPAITANDQIITGSPIAVIDSMPLSGTISSWSTTTIDKVIDSNEPTSIAIVNGNPAIAYIDGDNLKYVQATDPNGNSWNMPVIIDTKDDSERGLGQPSLAVINGNPAIAYVNWLENGHDVVTMSFVKAIDVDGFTWETPSSFGIWRSSPSLLDVNGEPAIAHYSSYLSPENYYSDINYMRHQNNEWNALHPPPYIGSRRIGNISLAIVNGKPAISFLGKAAAGEEGQQISYLQAVDADGIEWKTRLTLQPSTLTYKALSALEVIDNKPAIVYFDVLAKKLSFMQAQDQDGDVWQVPKQVASGIEDISYSALMTVSEAPNIIYYDAAQNLLKHVEATDNSGSSWHHPLAVNLETDAGSGWSAVKVNGQPAVSYIDQSTGQLKFLRQGSNERGTDFIYTPHADYCGNDQFDYYLEDGSTASNVVTVDISVSCPIVDIAPLIAVNDFYSTTVNTSVIVNEPDIIDNDIITGSTQLSITIANQPPNGTVTVGTEPHWVRRNIRFENGTETVINGKPAYSFINNATRTLHYVQASDETASGWSDPITIYNIPDSTRYSQISLAEIENKPAIVVYAATSQKIERLLYFQALDSEGTNWSGPAVVYDATLNEDLAHSSGLVELRFVGGRPAIFYLIKHADERGDGMHYLKYIEGLDASGSQWGMPIKFNVSEIDIDDQQGHWDYSVVNGNPAIAYVNRSGKSIHYLQADGSDNNLSQSITVTSMETTQYIPAYEISLEVFNGKPILSYIDNSLGYSASVLKFVQAQDVDGAIWSEPTVVDKESPAYYSAASLNIIDGFPTIAYSVSSDTYLYDMEVRYVKASGLADLKWGDYQVVGDSYFFGGNIIEYLTLQEVDGIPSLEYRFSWTCNFCDIDRPSGYRSMQLRNNEASFRYIPDAGYCGTDSFDYYLTNSETVSNRATVSIGIGDSGCGIQTVYLPVLSR